jgi:hypothetical protein
VFAALPVLFALLVLFYINFNRANLPDLDAFIRFEPPTIGHVYHANGQVLIELARERRKVIQYKDIPEVVRQAVLSAEDQNFFSHSGVDYSVFLRVLAKTNFTAMLTHPKIFDGADTRESALLFPQGGSTITQQLVRGYFLQKLTSTENTNTPQHQGLVPGFLACFIGVPSTNKFLRKVEEMRLSLWLEKEMEKHYGSKHDAKEELFARYSSFIYLGNGRYGFAAASQYYFDKSLESFTANDADKAALPGFTKSQANTLPTRQTFRSPCVGEIRFWPSWPLITFYQLRRLGASSNARFTSLFMWRNRSKRLQQQKMFSKNSRLLASSPGPRLAQISELVSYWKAISGLFHRRWPHPAHCESRASQWPKPLRKAASSERGPDSGFCGCTAKQ